MTYRVSFAAALTATALMAGCAKEQPVAPPAAQAPPPIPAEVVALIERAAIENLYADYCAHFGTGFVDYSQFFTQDGVLDVNGLVADGADAIKALYVRANGARVRSPKRRSRPIRHRANSRCCSRT